MKSKHPNFSSHELIVGQSYIWITLLIFVFVITACTSTARFSRPERLKSDSEINIENKNLEHVIQKWLNVPYLYGGTDQNGIDCSALSGSIYKEAYHINLPRTAKAQMSSGRFVRQPWLEEGDLLFFRDDRGTFQDHVGIYLGNGRFIHASSSQGVTISDLFSNYYQERLMTARRYLP